jgi:tRNA-dihydrouridine synthase
VAIPVIANGNVTWPQDVLANRARTGADGVMSAEGILANPVLFEQARKLQDQDWSLVEPEQARAHEHGGAQGWAGGRRREAEHRLLMRRAALEYMDLAEAWAVPLEVQMQHVSHVSEHLFRV